MKRKKISLICILFTFSAMIYSQEVENNTSFIGNHIFSMESSYLLKGLNNNGWGFGFSYEQLMFDCWSCKGSFSHMTIWPHESDAIVTTVGISLSTYFYPFFKKFNWLYFGGGCSTDFIQYVNYENGNGDIVINVFPQIGWKQSIKDLVFFDVFYRYNFVVSAQDLPDFAEELTKKRHEYGVSVKFNFTKLVSILKNKSRK